MLMASCVRPVFGWLWHALDKAHQAGLMIEGWVGRSQRGSFIKALTTLSRPRPHRTLAPAHIQPATQP